MSVFRLLVLIELVFALSTVSTISAADQRSCVSLIGSFLRKGAEQVGSSQRFIKGRLAASQTVETTLAAVAAKQANVIIFGESHVHYRGIERYPEFLQKLKKARPEINVLFIESSDRFQGAIDAYMVGGSYLDTVAKINRQQQGFSPLAHATEALLDEARALGIRVVAVDAESPDSNVRDVHMSNRITSYLRLNGGAGVMLVGKAHIYEKLVATHPLAQYAKTLSQNLVDAGVSITRVNMLSHSDFLKTCANCVSLESEASFGFKIPPRSKEIIQASPFAMVQPERWADYDFALVTP
jgi:hypothetical protein